jgi:hypothetical protein
LAKLILSGSTSGSISLESPAVSGTTTLTLPTTTDTLVGKTTTDTLTNKTLTSPAIDGTPTGVGVLTSSTAQATTSGTSKDFTGIPSWVKRITVMFDGVSTNGTSIIQIQLGDLGGIETTGYAGTAWTANTINTNMSAGLLISGDNAASSVYHGSISISLLGSNTWTATGSLGRSNATTINSMGGSKTLSATLDRVRITTVNGTDTFDAGSVNILYE